MTCPAAAILSLWLHCRGLSPVPDTQLPMLKESCVGHVAKPCSPTQRLMPNRRQAAQVLLNWAELPSLFPYFGKRFSFPQDSLTPPHLWLQKMPPSLRSEVWRSDRSMYFGVPGHHPFWGQPHLPLGGSPIISRMLSAMALGVMVPCRVSP